MRVVEALSEQARDLAAPREVAGNVEQLELQTERGLRIFPAERLLAASVRRQPDALAGDGRAADLAINNEEQGSKAAQT